MKERERGGHWRDSCSSTGWVSLYLSLDKERREREGWTAGSDRGWWNVMNSHKPWRVIWQLEKCDLTSNITNHHPVHPSVHAYIHTGICFEKLKLVNVLHFCLILDLEGLIDCQNLDWAINESANHLSTVCSLNPTPEQRLFNHSLATITRHDRSVKLWISPVPKQCAWSFNKSNTLCLKSLIGGRDVPIRSLIRGL